MFIGGIAIFVLLLAALCFLRCVILQKRRTEEQKKEGKRASDFDAGGYALSAVAVILLGISFAVTAASYSSQISDFEDIKRLRSVEAIYQAKANALTAEFAKYLAKEYPQHEREIFQKISPDKVALYLAKYPELKASATLIELVKRINKLQSDVYAQQIKIEGFLKETRFRLRNPWLWNFVIPTE